MYQKNAASDEVTKSFYAGGVQVAQMVNHTACYLHEDALGSVRLVTSPSLVTIFSSNFLPFGTRFGWAGHEETTYTGKQLDAATGLYYFDARYYDPTTGRFVTEDSYNGTMADPMSQNRYVYAGDDPMRYTDPTGHVMVVPRYTIGGSASSTTTTTLPERTCQQGEVRDWVQPVISVPWGRIDSFAEDLGAVLVATGATVTTALATSVAIASSASALSAIGGATLVGASAGVLSVAAPLVAVGLLAFATGYTIGYVADSLVNGQQATPQGAVNSFMTGLTLPFVAAATNFPWP